MPLTKDGKFFIVDSEKEIKTCGQWVRNKFAEYPYLILSVKQGRDRTIDQNSKLWPMLTDISEQVEWFGEKHDPKAWKDIATGSFLKGKFVPGIEGGFVVIGISTSQMNRQLFSAFIEYLYAFGADKGVVWSEKSLETIAENNSKKSQAAGKESSFNGALSSGRIDDE